MTVREQRAVEAKRLREQGLKLREIAERMECSRSVACDLIVDPDGSRAKVRRARNDGVCVDCGQPTKNGGGKIPPKRCRPCAKSFQEANAKWSREAILDAIKRWVAQYGEVPPSHAWSGTQASLRDLERFRSGDYPYQTQVVRRFGLWSAAIRAAGFECGSKLAGRPRNHVSRTDYEALVAMRDRGCSWREIGQQFDITHMAARQRYVMYMRKERDGSMPGTLKAETVIEREIARFEDRRVRAEREATEAAEQVERLKTALQALSPVQSQAA